VELCFAPVLPLPAMGRHSHVRALAYSRIDPQRVARMGSAHIVTV